MDILFVNVIYMACVNLCDPYLNLSSRGWDIGVLKRPVDIEAVPFEASVQLELYVGR